MTNQPEDKLFGDLEDDELNDAFGDIVQLDASPDEDAEAARKAAEEDLKAQTRKKLKKAA